MPGNLISSQIIDVGKISLIRHSAVSCNMDLSDRGALLKYRVCSLLWKSFTFIMYPYGDENGDLSYLLKNSIFRLVKDQDAPLMYYNLFVV